MFLSGDLPVHVCISQFQTGIVMSIGSEKKYFSVQTAAFGNRPVPRRHPPKFQLVDSTRQKLTLKFESDKVFSMRSRLCAVATACLVSIEALQLGGPKPHPKDDADRNENNSHANSNSAL